MTPYSHSAIPFTTLFVLFLLVSCKEKNDERNLLIAGKWFLQNAQRDGQNTPSLEGTVYEFTNDGKITTNISMIGSGTFKIQKDKLIQSASANIEYDIASLSQTALILKMKIREVPFQLTFSRDSLAKE